MPPHLLCHLLISRAADFIEFSCAISRVIDPGDGELPLVVDSVELVFASGDEIDVLVGVCWVFAWQIVPVGDAWQFVFNGSGMICSTQLVTCHLRM